MSRTVRQTAIIALVSTAALLSACAKKDASTTDSAGGAVAATPPASSTMTPAAATAPDSAASTAPVDPAHFTDANILAKEIAGDSGEVAVATLAQSMATSKAVKDYAALLVADHSKGLKEVTALASKARITPQTPAGDTTARSVSNAIAKLQGTPKGAAFDSAFVNHEIEDHQADIKDAEAMSGAAQNAQVKALVQKSLPELKKHLEKAQKISGGAK